MSQFKAIGKSMYGTKYELAGSMPFADPDLTSLKWGDVIKDNGGNGMTLYVNECGSVMLSIWAGRQLWEQINVMIVLDLIKETCHL